MRTSSFTVASIVAALLACRGAPEPAAQPSTTAPAVDPAPAGKAPDAAAHLDLAPPTAPRDLEAVPASPSRLDLAWTRSSDDTGVAAYEVVENGAVVQRTPERTAVLDGLSAGTEHCYTIVALDGAGNRSDAAGPICATTLDTTAPSAPATVALRAVTPTEVALSWDAATDDVGVTGYEIVRAGAVVARATAPGAADRSVRPAHRYCYEVVALDGAGNRSPPSPAACVSMPDVVPPSAPERVVATARTDREIALSWAAATDDGGVASYEVFRGETRIAATGALEAREAGLLPGSSYCYSVLAIDRAGNRSPASKATCATTPDRTPPTVPSRVVARGWSEHEISIGWAASEDDVGVAGYELLRDGKVVATVTSNDAAEGGLAPWSDHCYEVRAFDKAGNRSVKTRPACAKTQDLTAPSMPAEVIAAAPSDRAVALRWNASSDNVAVAAYEVLRDGRLVARGEQPVALERDLRPARIYCYTVRAVDPAGNRSDATSQTCATTPDLTPPSVPAQLAAAPYSPTQVVLEWGASADDVGVVGYEIVRGEEVVATASRSSAIVASLAPEQEHCLGVRAFDAAKNRSLVAGPRCAKTPAVATPAAPLNLRAERVTAAINLRWEPSPLLGALYAVYRDEKRIGMTRSQRYTVLGASAGQARCYQVAAVDDAGRESPRTFPACVAEPTTLSRR